MALTAEEAAELESLGLELGLDTGEKRELNRLQDALTPVNPGSGETPLSSPFFIGAGKQLTDMGRSAQDLFLGAGNMLGFDNQQRQAELSQEQTQANQQFAPLQESNPVQTFAGAMAPGLATIPLSGGILGQMGIGAVEGALDDVNNQGLGAAIGGGGSVVGKGIGSGLGSVLKMAQKGGRAAPGGEITRLANRADELGIRLTPGQADDSLPIQQTVASIKSNPTTSGLLEPIVKNNQGVVNELALKALGEEGSEFSFNVLGKAAKRIGSVYKTISEGVDNIAIPDLARFSDELGFDSVGIISNYVKRFPGLAAGNLSGKEWNKLNNLISKDIRGMIKAGNGNFEDLQSLQTLMLKGLESAAPGSKDVLRTAGQQWRILKALERGQSVSKTNVNPRSFATAINQFDKRFKRGQEPDDLKDLYDAVRVSNQFSDVVGNSGTATRGAIENVIQGGPTGFAQRLATRAAAKKFLESDASPLAALALGTFRADPLAGQAGAGTLRGLLQGDK